MYAGVSSGVSALESDNSSGIPEWKKILIMKKRAGCSPGADEHSRRNLDPNVNNVRNGVCESFGVAAGVNNKFNGSRSVKVSEADFREISPHKTVTIGNINVELRSVKSNDASISLPEACERNSTGDLESEQVNSDNCEDLRYGPGIVDRLRARFLNIGVKKQSKPVVRRFSSLENLPGSQNGPYRVNTRGLRQNGFKSGFNNVKKAQSMEALTCTTTEQHIFASNRRPNARSSGGVKARILSRNLTPIAVFSDENDKPRDKSPSPAVSPKFFTKSVRRWEYGRSVSASNINEDELPKPDTVKHVKKFFESPPGISEKSGTVAQRFRKTQSTTTPAFSTSPPIGCSSNGAITGGFAAWPEVKKTFEGDAKLSCAKEISKISQSLSTPDSEEEKYDDFESADSKALIRDNDLSANKSCEAVAQTEELHQKISSDPPEEKLSDVCGGEVSPVELDSPNKVAPEQLPLEQCHKHSNVLSQGNRLQKSIGAELDQITASPSQTTTGVQSSSQEESMVVAAAASAAASGGDSVTDSFPSIKKGAPTWQKPPQSTTSIVFDFRGKDVEPHISLNPAPFGCRPAKVSKNSGSKRSGSPPRSPVNGVDTEKEFIVEDDHQEDEEDWDEMDIGADLPAVSGIVFDGENVKIGRGSLLEKRNKKLNIQFDDKATSTFEYPSENTSPSPNEENGCWEDSFNPTIAMGSVANSRLSNYTPQVLSSNTEFELGVSQSNHRPTVLSPDKSEKKEDVPIMDVIIPANPSDTVGWSATETTDILF